MDTMSSTTKHIYGHSQVGPANSQSIVSDLSSSYAQTADQFYGPSMHPSKFPSSINTTITSNSETPTGF